MRKLMGNLSIPGSFWALIPLLSLALATSVNAASLCQNQRDFFAQQIRNRISVKALAEDFAASQAAIMLIGESHAEVQGPHYADLLTTLRESNPDLDCVTIEASHQTIRKMDYTLLSWRLLRDRAKELCLRVYNVDRCLKPMGPNDFSCMQSRNEFMSQRLETALTSGACHKIMHIGGSFHYQNAVVGAGPNMTERLLAKGIKSYRVQVVDTGMSQRSILSGLSVWNWANAKTKTPICAKRVWPVHKAFAFLNRGVSLASEVPVFYANGTITGQPWSDFEAALVLGDHR